MVRQLVATVAAVVCLPSVAACGSSGTPGQASGLPKASGIAFADCMRSHGVPNFPDPAAGGGIQITRGSGLNPFSPPFNPAANSIAIGRDGGFLVVPQTINVNTPVFQQAASVCWFGGFGGGHAQPVPSG